MSDEEEKIDPSAQAKDNSVAVGNFSADGNKGNIHVGNIIYNAPQDQVKLLFTQEKIDIDESFEPETILIPEGSFWMGSDPGEGVSIHEMPRHEVTLPVYRIGKFPVTNAQYEEYVRLQEKPVAPVLGWNGRKVPDGREDNPVMGVTLDDAKGYCKWLSEITKRKYELPNEAQLEKTYKGLYGCSDIIDNIYLWTCALWGEEGSVPESKYRRNPWKKDDGRNNPNANSQVRRVVCRYLKPEGASASRLHSLTGQLPSEPGLSGARHSFRVVMNV